MNTEQSPDLSLFCQVAELSTPAERAAYLDQACRHNPALRTRVDALLRAHDEAGRFLESNPSGSAATIGEPVAAYAVGTMIGPYKLREVLGEGGMGIVYVGEQEKPIRRKVALKVIKPGMDSKDVIARFEAERQALALMDHPNIAKVHEAGTTELGRPYFVMELVRGVTITDYCDRASVSLRERLELFIKVCHAVQHSHQKGIIHRDLKPSNVMITLHDGVPVPKVIDFGVAKAVNQRLTEHTVYTRHHQMVGTPMYMSPEQAELSGLDVDTRSDVYSLGVLLYELLTGTTPFDKEAFSKIGLDEIRRIIREDEPARPSHRVSTLAAEHVSTVSKNRGLEPRRLATTLHGELDWIAMKALEKDRARRYESADTLAADVQRYLDDQPVEACPPSVAYRLRKFVRRQRRPLSAIAVLVAALITGLVSAAVVVVVKDREGREIARINVPDGGSLTITDEKKSAGAPSASSKSFQGKPHLSGLIPSPQDFPGVGRWQLIRKSPVAFVIHNWKLGWSPDSRFVVFGDGNDVRVYSIPDFQLVHVLAGHTNSVIAADWSPDGRQIASSSSDNTIRLWDADTGVPGPVLVGHRDRVDAVAWHPDSRRLASGGRDNSVRLWTIAGKPGLVLHGHTDHVYSVAWNPDGTRLGSAGEDGTIRLWQADGKPETVIATKAHIKTIAWSPDGKQILASQSWSNDARTWNLDGTPGLELKGHTGGVVAAAWSPDGNQIASASWDGTSRLWNADGTRGPVLGDIAAEDYSVKWSPDGKWVATGSSDRSIRLWHPDGQSGPVLQGHLHNAAASWRPDGNSFAVIMADHTIRIFTADAEQKTVLEGQTNPVRRLEWSPDGRKIAFNSGGDRDRVRVWNVNKGTTSDLSPGLPSADKIANIKWSPNGQHIAFTATNNDDQKLHLWKVDETAGSILEGHRGTVYEVAWSPLDGRLASVSIDGTLRVWSAEGKLEQSFNVGELLASVAWKPDGTQLASGCENGTIQLWRPDGTPVQLLKGHVDRVTSVDWSGDGRWIASGGRDNTVRLWSADGEPLVVFRGHTSEVRTVRWRPHSAQFLSAGNDGTVRLWDAEALRSEWTLVPLYDKHSVKFSPDGRQLAGDTDVFEREFAYIIEKPTGAMDVVPPSEFERRTQNK